MIIGIIFIALFAVLMLAGAINTVFKGGEKEGICQYDYTENAQNEE